MRQLLVAATLFSVLLGCQSTRELTRGQFARAIWTRGEIRSHFRLGGQVHTLPNDSTGLPGLVLFHAGSLSLVNDTIYAVDSRGRKSWGIPLAQVQEVRFNTRTHSVGFFVGFLAGAIPGYVIGHEMGEPDWRQLTGLLGLSVGGVVGGIFTAISGVPKTTIYRIRPGYTPRRLR